MMASGSVVKVTADFHAIQGDELSAQRGETVQILTFSPVRGYLVRRYGGDGLERKVGYQLTFYLIIAITAATTQEVM
jgi:hypothetical protein